MKKNVLSALWQLCSLRFAFRRGAAADESSADRISGRRSGSRKPLSSKHSVRVCASLGYIEGKNIVIECRYAEGKLDRLPALAAELVRLKVDVIVTAGPTATRAAKEATTTIPIVMATITILLALGSSPALRSREETSRDCPLFRRS